MAKNEYSSANLKGGKVHFDYRLLMHVVISVCVGLLVGYACDKKPLAAPPMVNNLSDEDLPAPQFVMADDELPAALPAEAPPPVKPKVAAKARTALRRVVAAVREKIAVLVSKKRYVCFRADPGLEPCKPEDLWQRFSYPKLFKQKPKFEELTELLRSRFGWRCDPLKPRNCSRSKPESLNDFHFGWDLRAGAGTAITSVANDGVVVATNPESGSVTVAYTLRNHLRQAYAQQWVKYVHLNPKRLPKKGTKLSLGDVVGWVGAGIVGRSIAPHFHGEIGRPFGVALTAEQQKTCLPQFPTPAHQALFEVMKKFKNITFENWNPDCNRWFILVETSEASEPPALAQGTKLAEK